MENAHSAQAAHFASNEAFTLVNHAKEATCVVLIAYRPSSAVLENVETIRHQLGHTLVIDDGRGKAYDSQLSGIGSLENVTVKRSASTQGIAVSLI